MNNSTDNLLMTPFKENKEVPKEYWPDSLKGVDGISVKYYEWSKHKGTVISDKYQISVEGELPAPINYIYPTDPQPATLDNVLSHSFAQLRGISATGKGTRVLQIVMFLMTKFKWTFHLDKNVTAYLYDSNKYPEPPVFDDAFTGIRFPELNLLVLGARFVKSNKSRLLSLTGCDGLNTGYGFTSVIELTERYGKDLNILCEGYVSMCSSLLDIKHQNSFGQVNFFYKCFQHENKDDMLERFLSRSFHVAKGDAAWSQNEMHGRLSYEALNKDIEEIGSDNLGKVVVELNDPKEDVTLFGEQYLQFLGLPELVEEYKEFCSNEFNIILRDYRDADKNYDQLWYLWKFQNQEVPKPTLVSAIN